MLGLCAPRSLRRLVPRPVLTLLYSKTSAFILGRAAPCLIVWRQLAPDACWARMVTFISRSSDLNDGYLPKHRCKSVVRVAGTVDRDLAIGGSGARLGGR
ncbi:hypothetical protein C8R44DRAFT_889886 [Mycena epipterygia]|nr:hypothetical protein C8R44DRAFT_889886 [Mycena epipterygia]